MLGQTSNFMCPGHRDACFNHIWLNYSGPWMMRGGGLGGGEEFHVIEPNKANVRLRSSSCTGLELQIEECKFNSLASCCPLHVRQANVPPYYPRWVLRLVIPTHDSRLLHLEATQYFSSNSRSEVWVGFGISGAVSQESHIAPMNLDRYERSSCFTVEQSQVLDRGHQSWWPSRAVWVAPALVPCKIGYEKAVS